MKKKYNDLEIIDAQLLKYVKRKKHVSKETVIKKFVDIRFDELERKKYIYEVSEEKDSGFPPPSNKHWVGIGVIALTEPGEIALGNYRARKREEWIKFWIPVSISLIAIGISASALFVSISRPNPIPTENVTPKTMPVAPPVSTPVETTVSIPVATPKATPTM